MQQKIFAKVAESKKASGIITFKLSGEAFIFSGQATAKGICAAVGRLTNCY